MLNKSLKIKYIEDRVARHGTFYDRRQALFRETNDFCSDIPGTQAAAIVYSAAGTLFEFGNTNVSEVVDRRFAARSEAAAVRLGEALRTEPPAWNEAVNGLGLQELDELEAAVKMMKSAVHELMEASGGRLPARRDVS